MSRKIRSEANDNESLNEDFRGRTRQHTKRLERTRTLIKRDKPLPEKAVKGAVVTALGPQWIVAVDTEFWLCIVSGTVDIPHSSTIVAVGDVVWVVPEAERNQQGDVLAQIVRVEERGTLLSRKAAGKAQKEQVLVSNVDRLAVVMSAISPSYNKRLIDRYLIAADKGDLEACIVINKLDLFPKEYIRDLYDDFSVYRDMLQLPVFFVSSKNGTGIEELQEHLQHGATLLSGPSGVGKSSLINTLTDSRLRIGSISEKYDKGTHTTTSSIWLPLPHGGALIDSPGIREFACWELSKDELPWYFEEFTPFAERCKFTPCTHTHEPGCAVKQAVDDGLLDEERYVSYLNLRETI